MKDGRRRQQGKTVVHRDAFEAVVAGLVDAEELYQWVIEAGEEARGGDEAVENRRFLSRYIDEVNSFIQRCTVTDDREHSAGTGGVPFAVAGGTVDVEELSTGHRYTLHILGPRGFRRGGWSGAAVPILSPVGRAMLLARPGDVVTVPGDGGGFSYRVVRVALPAAEDGPPEKHQPTER